jgi:hypothetical protein
MTYLEDLPRCPECTRILRTRHGKHYCIDCETWPDGPPGADA